MENSSKNSTTDATTDALKNAFLTSAISDDVVISARAEDVQVDNSIDYSLHFFEPKPGSTYTIKFLPNPGGELITHRSVYKSLPDPERKGKTFHYVSSGNAKTCSVLGLFFELYELKKNGDFISEKKIDKYLSKTNQACAKIQILSSPIREEIGMIRMFQFSTFGVNAVIANLINIKINPSKEVLAQGESKIDIFNIFESPVMSLSCVEETYPPKDGSPATKGRGYSASSWLTKPQGAMIVLEDGKVHKFSKNDLTSDGNIKPEVEVFFNEFVKTVTNVNYDIYKWFSYKEVGNSKNDEDTNKYLESVNKKLAEILPIIRNASSLEEISKYGKEGTNTSSSSKEDKSKTLLADSIPDELKNSVMDQVMTENTVSSTTTNTNSSKDPIDSKNPTKSLDEAEAILNS